MTEIVNSHAHAVIFPSSSTAYGSH